MASVPLLLNNLEIQCPPLRGSLPRPVETCYIRWPRVLEREIAKIGWPLCRNLPWPRKVVSRTLANSGSRNCRFSRNLSTVNPGITKRSDSASRAQPPSGLSLRGPFHKGRNIDCKLTESRLFVGRTIFSVSVVSTEKLGFRTPDHLN